MPDDRKPTRKLPARVEGLGDDERPSSPRTAVEWPDEESSTRTTEATIAMPPPISPLQSTRALLTVVGGPNIGRVFSVRDDGSGFDPEQCRPGSGLGNMVDRVAALGGSLLHPARGQVRVMVLCGGDGVT